MRTYKKTNDLWNRLKLAVIIISLMWIASQLFGCSEEDTYLVRYELDCQGGCTGYYNIRGNKTDSLDIDDTLWIKEFVAGENDIAYITILFESNRFEEDTVILKIYVDDVLRFEKSEYVHLKRLSALVSP